MKILFTILTTLTLSFSSLAQNWLLDINEAKQQAKEENKTIIIVFQGSDWCGPCMKLEDKIWKNEKFIEHSKNKYVLLQADFPRKRSNRLSKEQATHNKKLADRYKLKSFPYVVLVDYKGNVLGKTGYIPEKSVDEYIDMLDKFSEK